MGEEAMSLTNALAIATELHDMVTRLETGLRLASDLSKMEVDSLTMQKHAVGCLGEFLTPAWAKLDQLHRIQRRHLRLQEAAEQ